MLAMKQLADMGEHAGELREYQQAVAARDSVIDDLAEHVELAGAALVILEEQGRITGDLSQSREQRQYLYAALTEAMRRELGGEILLRAQEPGLIYLLLFRRHIRDHLALDLVRQLLEDVLLHAPQDERHDMIAQVVHGPLILIAHDRRLIALLEFLMAQEVARHQEIEYRPELGQRILDRRTGQGEIAARLYTLDGPGVLRRRVLDMLGLIEDAVAEFMLLI